MRNKNNDYFKSSTEYDWVQNSYVKIEKQGNRSIKLIANREGLLSLAHQFEQLANSEDYDVCYDTEPGDLEEGSLYLEVVKVFLTEFQSDKVVIDHDTYKGISEYYSSKQSFTNGLSVREWLDGQSAEEQTRFESEVIRQFGGL